MRSAVIGALVLLIGVACGAPAIESDLATDNVPLPDRNPEKDAGASNEKDSSGGGDEKLTVTVTLSGGGTGAITSNPAGITCSGTTCTGSFDKGTALTLTAAPAAGSIFGGWSGACTGPDACAVKVDGALAITAELLTLDGPWAGTYTHSATVQGCTFNNSGTLNVVVANTAGLTSSANVTGLELRSIPGCQLGSVVNGTAPASPVTAAADTLTGTWAFSVQGNGGTLSLPFSAKIAGKKLTGTWTCAGCTGSFSVTKP